MLVGTVTVVGVLHTMVPDHWLPIAAIARQQAWSKAQTFRASLKAATGHVITTLLIAAVLWVADLAAAKRFGGIVDLVSSLALIAFGSWIGISALRTIRHGHSHSHAHSHGDEHSHDQLGRSTALILILGSSPVVESLPVFFSAGKYGVGLILVMALAFSVSTIATYVLLSLSSALGLQSLKFGSLERYGEALSGGFVAVVGLTFLIWPIF